MDKGYILLIDTHGPQSSVLIIDSAATVVTEESWTSDRTLGVRLLSVIDELFESSAVSWKDISRIAIHEGPGHYSALRTGVVTASLLAREKKIELVAVRGEEKETWVAQALENEATEVVVPKYS